MVALYPWILLVHIAAALALFAAELVSALNFRAMRHAPDLKTLRAEMGRTGQIAKVFKLAPPLLLLSGVALCALAWGFQIAWVNLSLLIFVVIMVMVRVVDGPRKGAIARAAHGGDGPVPADVLERMADPVLRRATRLRWALLVALVSFMTVKPGLWLALLVLGVLVGVALLWDASGQRTPGGRRVSS